MNKQYHVVVWADGKEDEQKEYDVFADSYDMAIECVKESPDYRNRFRDAITNQEPMFVTCREVEK